MRNLFFSFLFLFALLFIGCSNKELSINAELPAEVDALTKKRSIAVLPFKNDNINFSGRLESRLADIRVDGKPYFSVVSRDKIGDILKELKFQSSDLVGDKVAKFGRLVGAEVIITGNLKISKRDRRYEKPKEVCGVFDSKGNCIYVKTVYIPCKTSDVVLNVSINAIDVNSGKILDAFSTTKSYKGDSCKDYNFKSSDEAVNELADEVVDEYVKRIAPHRIRLNVELIDKVKSIDLNDKEETMFENALAYIEHGRLDKAEYLLRKLNELTGEKSYEIAYDLGVVEEALGKLYEARAAYELADKIIMDNLYSPNELVDRAIKRINYLIEKREKLNEQI